MKSNEALSNFYVLSRCLVLVVLAVLAVWCFQCIHWGILPTNSMILGSFIAPYSTWSARVRAPAKWCQRVWPTTCFKGKKLFKLNSFSFTLFHKQCSSTQQGVRAASMVGIRCVGMLCGGIIYIRIFCIRILYIGNSNLESTLESSTLKFSFVQTVWI